MSAKCRSCGAEIIWARTRNNHPMPLDAAPSANGNMRLDGLNCEIVPKADLERAIADGEILYQTHYSTCPQAKKWRKK